MAERATGVLASDFDGTIALTSEQCLGGHDVNGAYTLAISGVMGPDDGRSFVKNGGHNHRTPLEIVRALRPDISFDDANRLARDVSGAKLDILLGQIGTAMADGRKWPAPTEGFVDLWNELSGSDRIKRLLISAGHTSFLQRWFEVFDLEAPDAMVTHEVIEGMGLRKPAEQQAKPSRLVMKVGLSALEIRKPSPLVYVGDDPSKDGGLARNSGAKFVLITPETAKKQWTRAGKLFVPKRGK